MTGERFVAHIAKGKLAAHVALALAMVLGCFALVLLTFETGNSKGLLAGAFGLIFFGPVLINLTGLVLLRGPVLEIGEDGVRWRRWSNDLIPWSAIIRAEVRPQRVSSVLCLWLADPSLYPSDTLLSMPFRIAKSPSYGDLGLYSQANDRSFDEMIAAVHQFAPQLLAR